MPEGEKQAEETEETEEAGTELLQNTHNSRSRRKFRRDRLGRRAGRRDAAAYRRTRPGHVPVFGDNTPELWRWIHSHGDVVALLKQAHRFTGSLAARKDI